MKEKKSLELLHHVQNSRENATLCTQRRAKPELNSIDIGGDDSDAAPEFILVLGKQYLS